MLLVIGLAIIASFAIVAMLMDPSEGYEAPHDPLADLPIWSFLGRR